MSLVSPNFLTHLPDEPMGIFAWVTSKVSPIKLIV
jgi:hypothetical protein